MFTRRALILALLLLTPRWAVAQTDPDTIAGIIYEGKNHNEVMDHLKYLTKKIGPRLTSSPQLDRACKWTAQKFKEFGCQNVRLEQWGEWPVGFERGKRQVGRMVAPEIIDFEFTTSSWSPGTKGAVRGPAVVEPTSMEELEKVKDKLKGAWLLSRSSGFRRRAAEPTELEKAISSAEIAGRVLSSGRDLVITSGNYNITWDKLPTDVRVIVRGKDMDAIRKHVDAGKEVSLEFNLENKFVKGPRKNYNVVAEIPGTEKPDEVVIVSGHLDSWDGPGSEGACDNGTGCAVTLETARLLGRAKAKPKRTIRFILWTGEEQGLFGSAEYCRKHKDELDKISCVLVDDGGTNYQGGLTCTTEMEPMLKEAISHAQTAFPDLPMNIRIVNKLPRGIGSDHDSFLRFGVPGFFWAETGRANYGRIHHTQYDRFEEAIPEYLIQSSTNSAAAAYTLACASTLLPREKPAAPSTTTPPTPPTAPK
jgi:carboxypeptidase Q